MFIRSKSKKPSSIRREKESADGAKQKLVQDVFGRDGEDVNEVMPSPDKIVALLWIYRDDEEVVQYLCRVVETHVMKDPKLVDAVETYIPQLIQLALNTNDKESGNVHSNQIERLLLILAQLSTRFAIQYHWTLQNLLEDLEPEARSRKGRANDKFDMEYYARCMILSGDLDRCMSGAKPQLESTNRLAIAMTHGGKVTNDEVHSIMTRTETNRNFYDTIVELANENSVGTSAPGGSESVSVSVATLEAPLKEQFGGRLFFKKTHRRTVVGRRNPWKERYFAVEENMLNCYSRERKLLRSMSLEGATIWKGPQQDKYPLSFIVANNTTMFHLRAATKELKSAWKHNLRQAIKDSALPEDLSESQRERYELFQNAKWFGRTLTEVTNDLDHAPGSERSQLLQDSFFELEIPRNTCWLWRHQRDGSSDNPVFVVLPHFSHLTDDTSTRKRVYQPRFQASFMLKRDETAVGSFYETFIEEGRQKNVFATPVMPDTIRGTLESTRRTSDEAIMRSMTTKDAEADTGSTTGDSTEDLSVADSNISGYHSTASEPEASDNENKNNSKHVVPDIDNDAAQADSSAEKDKSFEISAGTLPSRFISDLTVDHPAKDIRGQQYPARLSLLRGPKEDEEDEIEKTPNLSVELVLKGTQLNKQEDTASDKNEDTDSKTEDSYTALNGENETSNPARELMHRSSSFFDTESFQSGGSMPKGSPKSKGLASLVTKPYHLEEVVATQLAQYYETYFAPSMIWVRAPRVRRVGKGMVVSEVQREKVMTVADAKATLEGGGSLMDYFIETHGSPKSESFQEAQRCFAQSLAGMTLMSYLLGIKNRQDGNLMLDSEGHIYASDYSSALGSDSSALGSQDTPFKFNTDYLDVLGGPKGRCYQFFRCLVVSGLKRARADSATAIGLLLLVPGSRQCRKKRDSAAHYLRQKLMLDTSDDSTEKKMRFLMARAHRPALSKSRQALRV